MKPKTLKLMYWVVTGLFCLANFASGVAELMPPNQATIDVMAQLGYPLYLLTILGFAKVAGSIVIIQTKWKTIKEWAYAGFTIDYIGASWSFWFVNKDPVGVIFPLVFLAVMFWSYWLWKKMDKQKAGA
jgi:hypothetical protein